MVMALVEWVDVREVAALGTSDNCNYRTWPCPVTALAAAAAKEKKWPAGKPRAGAGLPSLR
jgi:hypothetical protein